MLPDSESLMREFEGGKEEEARRREFELEKHAMEKELHEEAEAKKIRLEVRLID